MKHKLLSLLAISGAAMLLPSASSAAPLVSIGDNTDIFFNGSSSLRWTSNVFRDEDDEVDDLIWTLSPGFEVNVGRGVSNADLSIVTRYDILRYQDLDQLDTELFHIRGVASYSSSRLDLNGLISFDEEKSNSGDVNVGNDLIESDNIAARFNAEYRISPKFSLGVGLRYREEEYKAPFDDQFADRETFGFPVDVFYELTPKVDLSLGYEYSTTEVESTLQPLFVAPLGEPTATQRFIGGYDQSSHFFNIGARGNLLPKLSGFFKVGYRTRQSDDSVTSLVNSGGAFLGSPDSTDRDDNGILGLNADLTWAATPKLTARLDLARDFGVGGEGQSTENSSVNMSASYSISSRFAASANVRYTLRDFSDDNREDHQYGGGLRLSYVPNQYWRFGTGYSYNENDSNSDDRSYQSHSIDLSATLRY